ncbi:MAG TPA: XrtA system polysaccharide chain length determinant [Gammaproteobacteria bacterium]|nr:XrtA system polysaccharide chain length determinant [Gammaproteobacteria bacterium]
MDELLTEIISQARSAWRFRWYGVAVAWGVALLGWGVVAYLPDIYEGSTRIYVDTSSVLKPLLNKQIVASDIETRLLYVRQALLGKEYLERVANENGLFAGAKDAIDREGVIDELRDKIWIDAVQASREPTLRPDGTRDTSSIFTISYRHRNPTVALGVVTTVLNLLQEATLGENRENTETAARFLDARIGEYENRLQQSEQALADFRKANSGRLPGEQGSYFERMQKERDTLQETKRKLNLAESKRNRLQEQLRGEVPVVNADNPGAKEPPPNSLDARIRDRHAELDRLLLQYTEKHPDVIATRAALEQLEKQRADQLRALGVNNPDQQLSTLGSNPVYQALQISLNEAELDVATLQADIRDREQHLKELQGLINEVPEVEAELTRLNRDYNTVREQYLALTQSRETEKLSRKASDTDQTEFRVLNPPATSSTPVAPRRLLLLAAVLAAAFGACGGLCYVLAQVKPVFGTAKSLRDFVGLPVLGTVSRAMVIGAARVQRRLALMSFSAAMASLIVLFGVVVFIEILGPGFRALARGVLSGV